jgi:hypothetical protein
MRMVANLLVVDVTAGFQSLALLYAPRTSCSSRSGSSCVAATRCSSDPQWRSLPVRLETGVPEGM